MATLHCKSCGRVYNYEKNGTCPKCGAYNRPPRKEIVEADGSIRYVTTEQKVCYEEKECHEEDVRQEVRSYNYTPGTPDDDDEEDEEIGGQDNAVKKLWQHRDAIATSGGKKSVAAIAVITALISVITPLIANFSNRHQEITVAPWESVAEEAAAEVHNLIAHEGNELYTEYGSVTINSCQVKGDVLHLDLRCDDINSLTIMGYYETLTDSCYLKIVEAYSSGDLYTYLVSLPEDITASDCAAVLDIPFEAGINRYWVWPEHPTYEPGEDFYLNGQRLFVSKVRHERNGVDVSIDCEWDILSAYEVTLTALNTNGLPYTTSLQHAQCTINMTDGRNTDLLNFTLRSESDTPQSITLLDNETMRQVTVNLQ